MNLFGPVNALTLNETNLETLLKMNEKQKPNTAGGFFPVGRNNYWHGGIHLIVAPKTDGTDIITNVADGEVIAYRMNSDFKQGAMAVKKGAIGFKKRQKVTNNHQEINEMSFYVLAYKKPDSKARKVKRIERKALWVRHKDLKLKDKISEPGSSSSTWYRYNVKADLSKAFKEDCKTEVPVIVKKNELLLRKNDPSTSKVVDGVKFRQLYLRETGNEGPERWLIRNATNCVYNPSDVKDFCVWPKTGKFTNLLYERDPDVHYYNLSNPAPGTVTEKHNLFESEIDPYTEKTDSGDTVWWGFTDLPGVNGKGWLKKEEATKKDGPVQLSNLYKWGSHFEKLEESGNTYGINDGFCDIKTFLNKIEKKVAKAKDKELTVDNKLTAKELIEAVKHPDIGPELRRQVALFPSEWADNASQEKSIKKKLKSMGLSKTKIEQEIWPIMKNCHLWNDSAKNLPANHSVWHFHPLMFVYHVNKLFKTVSRMHLREILSFSSGGRRRNASFSNIDRYLDAINQGLLAAGIITRFEQAHILSQITVESARLIHTRELSDKKWGDDGYFNHMEPVPENFFSNNAEYKKNTENKIAYFMLFYKKFWSRTRKTYFDANVFGIYNTENPKLAPAKEKVKTSGEKVKITEKELKAANASKVAATVSAKSKELEKAKKDLEAARKELAEIEKKISDAITSGEEEYANWAKGKANSLGNNIAGDGVKFCGKGLIQLTGRENSTSYAKNRLERGLDKDINPTSTFSNAYLDSILKKMIEDPAVAMDTAAYFWKTDKLHGGRVKRKDIKEKGKVTEVTKMVNGGSHGLAERRESFKYAYELFHLKRITGKNAEDYL